MDADIVVIGSGAAGIAACAYITQCNPRLRCIILEGRDRVGGRLHTVTLGRSPVDVGGSWIHQWGTHNPIYEVVQELGCELVRPHAGSWEVFDGPTGKVVPESACTEVQRVARRCLAAIQRAASVAHSCAGPDSSAAHAYESVYKAWVERRELPSVELGTCATRAGSDDILRSPALRKRLLDWYLARTEQYEGAGFHQMSLKYWDAGGELPGGDAVARGGYGALLEAFAKTRGLDVRTGHVVRRIAKVGSEAQHFLVQAVCDQAEAEFACRYDAGSAAHVAVRALLTYLLTVVSSWLFLLGFFSHNLLSSLPHFHPQSCLPHDALVALS